MMDLPNPYAQMSLKINFLLLYLAALLCILTYCLQTSLYLLHAQHLNLLEGGPHVHLTLLSIQKPFMSFIFFHSKRLNKDNR